MNSANERDLNDKARTRQVFEEWDERFALFKDEGSLREALADLPDFVQMVIEVIVERVRADARLLGENRSYLLDRVYLEAFDKLASGDGTLVDREEVYFVAAIWREPALRLVLSILLVGELLTPVC